MSHPGKPEQALPALCQHAGRVSKTNVSTRTLTDVTPDMAFFRNEISGAVAAVVPVFASIGSGRNPCRNVICLCRFTCNAHARHYSQSKG